MPTSPTPWSITAVNLAEHADNPVHTVAGGRAAGYAGAVVAGTTVYAYLTRPAAAAWGTDWVGGGTAEVRFRAPVLADEEVTVVPRQGDDGAWVIDARNPTGLCATLAVGLSAVAPPDPVGDLNMGNLYTRANPKALKRKREQRERQNTWAARAKRGELGADDIPGRNLVSNAFFGFMAKLMAPIEGLFASKAVILLAVGTALLFWFVAFGMINFAQWQFGSY